VKFVFVLEDSMGHATHAQNLARTVREEPGIEARVVWVRPQEQGIVARLPVLGSWSFQASWQARAGLTHRVDHDRADALYIHTQVAALLSARTMRHVPTLISLDATPMNYDSIGAGYGHRRGPALIEWAKTAVNRRALTTARGLITWSRWAAQSLTRDYGLPEDRVHVIPPGVDLRRFRPRQGPRPDGPLRVLFGGGDFRRKGGDDLLAAFDLLRGAVQADVVSVTAPGDNGAAWRRHTSVRPQSPELIDLYQRADVFVLPSRSETFGLAVAEALACGLPVITTRVGAFPEMVRDGVNGHLVPPGSPHLLAEAIRSLIDHPERRAAMGAASLDLARQAHDADRNNRAIVDLMARLASAN
jgi:glycosyltransferase involved in cell wall biosynthesis